MLTKHFFKTVLLFTAMILLALLGLYWISGMEGADPRAKEVVEWFAE
ncbi:MAG TPA: hypothetical protein VFQ59_01290 [Candidatus Paceibacterota bacterium]|nr:hypothetical protein [Candidatus Paceibacterota bacterium]